MIRSWLAGFGLAILLLAIVAHLLQLEAVAEGLGNVLFFALAILALMAIFGPRRQRKRDDPLTITIVAQDDLSKHSGYAYRVDRVARAIADLGHRVSVVGFSSKRPAIAARCVRLPWMLGRFAALTIGFFLPSDVVVITSIGALYNGLYALALRATERSIIYDSQDPVLETLAELHGEGSMMRRALAYVAWLERLMDRCASATLVAGPMEISVLRARGWRGPLLLVYNINEAALSFENFGAEHTLKPGWESATIVVYVGGLQREMRGIEAQIEAVALARDLGADVRLLLVGFGDRTYFESQAAELLLQDAAAIVPDMPYARLLRVLSRCDAAVSSEPIRYGMQTKMFDYAATGVQLVAIDDGRDILTTFGDLIIRYDGTTSGLAHRLVRLSRERNAAERERRRQAGLALLRRLVPESRANLERALALVPDRASGATDFQTGQP